MFDGQTFDFSYPTASVYMRIAKLWNDPHIKDAREKGHVDSINSFLNTLKVKKQSKHPSHALTPQERQDYDKLCRYLCTEFEKNVLNMKPDEVQILYEGFDDFWSRWYADIKKALKPKVKKAHAA